MERPNQDLETTLRCMTAVNLPLLVSLVASQLTHSTEYWMFIEYVGPGSILWTGNAMALRSAPGFLPRTSWTLKLFKNFMLASPVVLKGTSGAVPRGRGPVRVFALLCYILSTRGPYGTLMSTCAFCNHCHCFHMCLVLGCVFKLIASFVSLLSYCCS